MIKLSQEIQDRIASSQHIAIFGHDNPDGDAIGSMLGLGRLLENMHKKIYYFASPAPSRIFDFLPDVRKIKTSFDYKKKYNLIIFVDFSWYDRCVFTAGQYDYFDSKPLIIIDHHLGSSPMHALVCKDSDADSNCEWIFENTKTIRSDYYDRDVASYLYLGLATDTGNFQYDKQGARSLSNATALVELWANKQLITKKIFGTVRLAQLQFLSVIMPRFVNDHGIGYVWYSHEDFEEQGLDREEASGYITTIVSRIEWLRLAMIFKIESDCIKISFRSQDESINAAQLAEHFGGGGHFYAAGAKITNLEIDRSNQNKSDMVKSIVTIVKTKLI